MPEVGTLTQSVAAASAQRSESASESEIEDFVRSSFVDVFVSQSRRAQLGLMVTATLIAWVWHARTQDAAALVWLGAAAVVTLMRILWTERWVRAGKSGSSARRIALLLAINGVLMALPVAAFPQLTEIERAALSIILVGVATGSVATTSGYRWVFLAFATPMLLSLVAAWALTPHAEEGAATAASTIALLLLMYLLFLLGVGRQAQLVFEESSRFRYGEHESNQALQLALESAAEANRAKTQFLAYASHDLRQNIHSMNVLVAALSLRELDERSSEIVKLLVSVNQTLLRQLDGLLDVSKLDAGIVQPQLGFVRLDRMLEAHFAALVPVARERKVRLELAQNVPLLAMTDGVLLARVVANLSENALKYTPSGGAVTLSLVADGVDALLTVADTGIGIPEDEQVKVFREFYQVDGAERDRTQGLGLGLAIVRRLCELLSVCIALQSEPGVGTRVALRLGAAPARGAPQPVPVAPPPPQGLVVLVVDDEPLVRESMRLLLIELRCEVHLAASTEQAESMARAHALDVVLSDFRLREGDSGIEALRAVRRHRPEVRCALVTGDTSRDRLRDARALGVPLLHKPVTLPDLLALLQPGAPTTQSPGAAA